MSQLTIRDIRARAVEVPISRPVRTASGEIEKAPLLLIDVLTDQGITGCAYAFGYTRATLRPLLALAAELRSELIGQPVVPYARMRQMERRFRLLGLHGLLGMLVSTLDMAYWDALGKAANQPVVQLLGGEAAPVRAYDSYGMVDPVNDAAALRRSLEQGFRAIKIKVGYPDPKRDVEVVRAVRELIGPDIALMVDFNQSQSPADAILRARALQPFDLCWIEEPVLAEDLQGHAKVREATGMCIQTGENWWFPRDAERALSAGACDKMMPDLMKIGGITGWLSVSGLAAAASMPVSSHLFIEGSAHVLPVTPTCDWLEFMDFGSAVLQDPYRVDTDGCVRARGPGLGMAWDEAAVARHQIS
jgi:mandelate racemase